jgi:hypothetical protein
VAGTARPTLDTATASPSSNATTSSPTAAPPRQKVNIVSTIFSNNKQGFSLVEATTRGAITTGSGFNDIEISWSEFNSNVFETDGVSIACLP